MILQVVNLKDVFFLRQLKAAVKSMSHFQIQRSKYWLNLSDLLFVLLWKIYIVYLCLIYIHVDIFYISTSHSLSLPACSSSSYLIITLPLRYRHYLIIILSSDYHYSIIIIISVIRSDVAKPTANEMRQLHLGEKNNFQIHKHDLRYFIISWISK